MSFEGKMISEAVKDFEEKHVISELILLGFDGAIRRIIMESETDVNGE